MAQVGGSRNGAVKRGQKTIGACDARVSGQKRCFVHVCGLTMLVCARVRACAGCRASLLARACVHACLFA